MAANPGERIEFPDGSALYYVEADHSYWRCKPDGKRGQRLTGVTTVVKPIDFRPDNLMKWAANLNCDGVAELVGGILAQTDPEAWPDALGWLDSGESIREALEEGELTWQHLRDRRAREGTNVHELALRALAMGKSVPDYDALLEEERGYADAVVAYWLDHSPKPTHVEQVVLLEEEGVAGRFDLRAEHEECDREACPCHKGGLGLVDAKTSGYISEGHHAQVMLYEHGAIECGIGPSDWQGILRLADNGTYELLEAQATTDDALAAVDLYRRAARIKRDAGKARKAAAKEAVPA